MNVVEAPFLSFQQYFGSSRSAGGRGWMLGGSYEQFVSHFEMPLRQVLQNQIDIW